MPRLPKPRKPARRIGRPPLVGVTFLKRVRVDDDETAQAIKKLSPRKAGDALAQITVKRDAPKGEK